ncbi:MAG: cob(I)yrinic acid a,c-diamide adenosyltransferase, partial [Candidatus Omnitrophica bacterium]|nr:cob(I)yrinic acid a,c-diamide adenosyltransferase [Candidatus Omnitrophota bacterium]
RGATAKLIACADYVTYMREEKHPFRSGVKARRGIEF